MRATFSRLFKPSPFDSILRHAEKVRETAQMFRNAFLCYMEGEYKQFEELHEKVSKLESEADDIKRNIRGHLPRWIFMPMEKFPFLWYLREQDKVCDAAQDVLHWLSFRATPIPDQLSNDMLKMVSDAVASIEQLVPLIEEAKQYFQSFSEADRSKIKARIAKIRLMEYESDEIERNLTRNIFIHMQDPIASFHLIRLVQILGEITDHAENAGDMMRTMIAR